MVKGHNKGSNDADPENKTQGQHRHLSDKKKDKSPHKGRNAEEDPSEGTKGKNSI